MNICGSYIGRANAVAGVTWYVDASSKAAAISLPYFAPDPTTTGTWVRLTKDCSRGADVTISDPGVVQISDRIHTKDGYDAAVRLSPASPGHATVAIQQPGSASRVVIIAVATEP